MAEQNILAGDVNVLDQMINDLNVHKETIERQGRLAESIGDIAKNTKEAQQAVQDEIDSRVKDSSDAVCAGFDKAIAGDREKLKEVQNKRDKAKLAGVKERIAAETAHIHKENEALKNQVKDAFAQENIPMFCNSRIYIALYRTKRMTDVLIYLLRKRFWQTVRRQQVAKKYDGGTQFEKSCKNSFDRSLLRLDFVIP